MALPEPKQIQRAALWLVLALVSVALVWGALRVVSPSPPRSLSMTTGAADGAYHQFALRYQAILKENGISLVLLPSSGSVENLKRLNDGSASVGFVQGGLGLLALSPQTEEPDTGPQGTDFPLSEEADSYFNNGRPFLQRYLPFWLANFVQRLILVVVPLVAVVFPLFKLMPTVLNWKQEKKLFRRCGALKFLEHDIASRTLEPEEASAAHWQLNRKEAEVMATRFSLDFSDSVYTLRQHLDYVRAKLETQHAKST